MANKQNDTMGKNQSQPQQSQQGTSMGRDQQQQQQKNQPQGSTGTGSVDQGNAPSQGSDQNMGQNIGSSDRRTNR